MTPQPPRLGKHDWIPACAGMTRVVGERVPPLNVIPLESGIHAVSALPPKADILRGGVDVR